MLIWRPRSRSISPTAVIHVSERERCFDKLSMTAFLATRLLMRDYSTHQAATGGGKPRPNSG